MLNKQYIISGTAKNFQEGLYTISDGQFLAIKDGLASVFSSFTAKLDVFANEIGALIFDDSQRLKLNSDGTFKLTLPDQEYSFVFSYLIEFEQNGIKKDNSNFIFDSNGPDNPADPNYYYKICFADGICQAVPPMVFAPEQLKKSLGLSFTINRLNGVIKFEEYGSAFKSDYMVYPLQDEVKSYYETMVDSFGVALMMLEDINQDGLDDYLMITSEGCQVLYMVKQY